MKAWITKRRARLIGLVAVMGALGAFAHSRVRLGVVVGDSMSPTLKSGSLYAMDAAHYRNSAPQRGEVVVFERAGTTYIKRVAATAGDTIYLLLQRDSPDGEVLMDWQLEGIRKILSRHRWGSSLRLVRRTIPPGFCYVLGDNISNSVDSRYFGPVLVESLLGRVVDAPPPTPVFARIAAEYAVAPALLNTLR